MRVSFLVWCSDHYKGNILSYFIFILVAAVFTGCAVIIGANNSDTVSIDYFINSTSFPLSMLMGLCFALGAILSSVIWGFFSLRLKLKLTNSESQRKQLVKETVK